MSGEVPGYSLDELVANLGGEVRGDGSVRVSRVASLGSAGPGDISFLYNPRLKSQFATCRASAVIVNRAVGSTLESGNFIVADNPQVYFARVAQLLHPPRKPAPGIHPSAVVESEVPSSVTIGPLAWVGRGVKLGENVSVGAGCHVGEGVSIGDDSTLSAGVTLYADCHLGKRVIIHSGTVIGADGFGYAREKDGSWLKIPQIGRVIIGDDVEIGANTTVDRGAMDDTFVDDGVIIDNQVQVGHNVRIGRHTAIAGCTGIAGSTRIGARCMFGGASMIVGHLDICDDAVVSATTGITKNITAPGVYTGSLPQQPHQEWLKQFSHLRHLDEMADKIRALEKRLAELGDKAEKTS